eukprot:MONOS_6974.1-p1 / transcript=MONOS_6974.1 / gene=MONOS_6974 / organism=Monocercomonoides_exilis_PA203 / gene_product=5' nucleotidase family protein / transcript_product=5' nucleotidase family protein / location=Mono_scaffold00229:57355-59261(-) / protein_length=510 / sequence_SO=supercontig / SO=protein_coding / is_pseudo=false
MLLYLLAALIQVASASQSNNDTLKFTLIHTSDVHGYINKHHHVQKLDVTAGDVYNFIDHMKAKKQSNEVVFAFDTGDLTQGTGLSDATNVQGDFVFEVIKKMNYDSLCIGNHELKSNGCIKNLVENVRPFWAGRYLGANAHHVNPKKKITDQYYLLPLPNNQGHALVMGFVVTEKKHDSDSIVAEVSNTLREPWVKKALSTPSLQMVICLCHINSDNPDIDIIIDTVKKQRPDLPIVLLTGHSHKKRVAPKMDDVYVMESGKYMETIGVLEFELPLKTGGKRTLEFNHTWLTANQKVLKDFAMVKKRDKWETKTGDAINRMIAKKQEELGLDKVIGHSSGKYAVKLSAANEMSLSKLMAEYVIPYAIRNISDKESISLFRNNACRSPLYPGEIYEDDMYAIYPNTYNLRIIKNVNGTVVKKIIAKMGVSNSTGSSSTAYVFSSTNVDKKKNYDLVMPQNEIKKVNKLIKKITGASAKVEGTKIKVRDALRKYIVDNMNEFVISLDDGWKD